MSSESVRDDTDRADSQKNSNPPLPVMVSIIVPIGFVAIWSGGAIFAKVGLQYTDSWSFLLLRSLIAFGLLSVLLIIDNSKNIDKSKNIDNYKFNSHTQTLASVSLVKMNLQKISIKERLRLLASGLLLQVLYLTFYFSAINTGLSLGIIILILGTQPIVTSLFSAHQVSFKAYSLLSICFAGLVLATMGYHQIDGVSFLGLLLSVLALLSMTFGTMMQANVCTKPIVTLWTQTLLSLAIFASVVSIKGFTFTVTVSSILALLWMGAVVSVGAYLLLMLVLKYSRADKVSTLFFVLPLLTMILESMVFGTVLTPLTISGVIVVCLALFFYRRLPISQA